MKGISTRYFILVVNMLHSQRVSIRNILVTMSTAECLFSVTRCFILVIIMFHSVGSLFERFLSQREQLAIVFHPVKMFHRCTLTGCLFVNVLSQWEQLNGCSV